jgi:UV DNA damage endonuclease
VSIELCSASRTFRLKPYSGERIAETLGHNLYCLREMLEFNVPHGFLFFRITSDLVPFASHPVCTYAWPEAIAGTFRSIGVFFRKHDLRVSLHPDQFILINAKDPGIVMRSVTELRYQAEILDLLETDAMEKIQIYVGGLCGEREKSLARFVERYEALPGSIRWLSGAFLMPRQASTSTLCVIKNKEQRALRALAILEAFRSV